MDQRPDTRMTQASAHSAGSTRRGTGDGARGGGSPAPQAWERGDAHYGEYEEHGYGWVMFAGVMISIVGVINFIYGIAAIANSKFYVANAVYIVSDLNTWGWVIMFTGVVQFAAAMGIFMRAQWARWVGVATASVNAIIQLIFIAAYPLASLAIFAIDILVLYGLLAYGARVKGSA